MVDPRAPWGLQACLKAVHKLKAWSFVSDLALRWFCFLDELSVDEDDATGEDVEETTKEDCSERSDAIKLFIAIIEKRYFIEWSSVKLFQGKILSYHL